MKTDRIPLRTGKTPPQWAESMLSVFGNNPFGEPMYRIIWSENKDIFFCNEVAPEYLYLAEPTWVLEVWTDPEKDAGPRAHWGKLQQELMGDYPRFGTYNYVQSFSGHDEPSEEEIRLYCVALEKSKDLTIKQRREGIVDKLEKEEATKREEVAESILELQDSASLGLSQQAVSGPKNNFRTLDDYERDLNRSTPKIKTPRKGMVY